MSEGWGGGGEGDGGGGGWAHLFQIHGFHGAFHPAHDAGHAARYLPHRHGGLDPAGDGVDPRAEAEEVEFLVLLADRVLGVDLGDVGVVLLDGLWGGAIVSPWSECAGTFGWKSGGGSGRTFLSLFFSAVSSLPALAAWRFSCFAVNWGWRRAWSAVWRSPGTFHKKGSPKVRLP